MQDFEKLGSFYLGRLFDLDRRQPRDSLLLYDSRDLVTHAACVGMTGSGKTGLCVGLIEEAAIDGIPAVVIDPKGDLSNLLLTFPDLRPEDFLPWISEDEARTKGLSPAGFAAQQAALWQKGLAEWGQDGARIARLKQSADLAIYTPGSDAGIPVSILGSFAPPDPKVAAGRETMRERVTGTATSLLGLLGIDADPLQSREHILVSTLLDNAWKQGRALDLGALIREIQNPPVTRIGVLDLDSFFPATDRFALSMSLNNLLASPGFECWLEGESLDLGRILHGPSGKPRIAIFSIAHLGDAERMFFVSLLLNQVLGWMRAQSGTTSLRALLYMDEIFGYFPPVRNPPSKQPLLTLLKQARAFGLGVVLATQNPVDLDYKGLANTGTWFIGRLQTERDKLRVLDGLEGAVSDAGKSFDRASMDRLLSGLGSRVFLMNNVHEDAPEIFQTRWTLSYLRGPLTRDQIRTLTSAAKPVAPAAAPPPAPVEAAAGTSAPALPPDVPRQFLPVRKPAPAEAALLYRPMLIGAAQVHFLDLKNKVDVTRDLAFLTEITGEAVPVNWDDSAEIDIAPAGLAAEPDEDACFAGVPPPAAKPRNYAAWGKNFTAWLFQNQKIVIYRSPGTGLASDAGESERDFRVRLQQAAREQRDRCAEDLRARYAPRIAALQDRIRRAQLAVQKEQQEASAQKLNTVLSVGTTLLGAFLGRKAISATTLGRATTVVRSATRAGKEAQDVARASENVAALQQQLAGLEVEFQADTAAAQARLDPSTEPLDTVEIRLKKTNIALKLTALAWTPYWQSKSGTTPAW